ncbi:MAG: hypothetical protein MZV64_05125 [Ignavibacteriales bacterium]|nr:hypothetical protein [Ignavibacteriales bacterium]
MSRSPGSQKPDAGLRQVRGGHQGVARRAPGRASRTCRSPSRTSRRSARSRLREVVAEVVKSMPRRRPRRSRSTGCWPTVDKSQILPKNVEGVKADPPTIFFSQTPAVLVNIDGDPIWSPIKENDLKFAVNTNWDLFQHEPTKTFYLLHDGAWLKTTDLKGAWTAAGKLPASFSKLPGRRELEGDEGRRARQEAGREQGAEGLREHRRRPR